MMLECKMLESSAFGGNMVALEDDNRPRATVTKLPDVDDPQFQEFIKNDEIIVFLSFHFLR